jgi:MOSC domain-containing protein YiiM
VHLIPKEILDARDVAPGQIGENVTTVGIDLLALGKGTKLHFLPPNTDNDNNDDEDNSDADLQTPHAVVVIQGVRNPCPQIDRFRPGLKESFVVRGGERRIVGRTAGVMGTVEAGGEVKVGMRVVVEEMEGEFEALGCV